MDDLTFDDVPWSPRDIDRFRALYESAFPADERDDTDDLVAGILADTRPHVVARRNGQLVGFVVFSYLGDTHIVFLEYMAVLPELRSRGIGADLLAFLRAYVAARDAEVRGFVLEVDPPDDAAGQESRLRARRVKFYLRNGAELVSELARFTVPNLADAGTVDLQLMWIPLRRGPRSLGGEGLRDCIEAIFVYGYGLAPDNELIRRNQQRVAG